MRAVRDRQLHRRSAGYDLADVMPCLTDRDPLVRAATAIAIALSKGADAPREVVAVLRESSTAGRKSRRGFTSCRMSTAHVLAYLALRRERSIGPDARSLAQALCERIDEVDGRSAVTYGQGLLALALGDGERPFAKRFVEILHTSSGSKQFWSSMTRATCSRGGICLARRASYVRSSPRWRRPDPEAMMHAHLHAGDGLDHADPGDDEH